MTDLGSPPPEDPNRGRVSDELIKKIREEAIAQGAKWAIAAFGTLALAAVAGWVLYLKPKLVEYVGGVPVNTVIAFDDRAGCAKLGSSWEDAGFSGKVIVGASNSEKKFDYGASSGNPSVTLDGSNMPEIFLSYEGHNFGNNTSATHPLGIGFVKPPSGVYFTGGNANPKPIDLYPPYEALFFCRKKS